MSVSQEFIDFLASLEELKERQGKKPEAECREHYEKLIHQYFEFRGEKAGRLSLRQLFRFPEVSDRMAEVGKPYPDLLKKFKDKMEAKFEIPKGIENEGLFPEKLREHADDIRKQTGND